MDNTKKKRNVPITIVFLCGITGLIVGAFLFGYKTLAMVHSAGNASRIASQIEQIIAEYIREGDGHFPLNEVDLQHRGLISKVDANGMIEYFMNPSPLNNQIPESQAHWIKLWDFDLFRIAYGTRVEDIEVVNGVLYDIGTKKEILLLDGPYSKYLKNTVYLPISLRWYQLMKTFKTTRNEPNSSVLEENVK